MKFFSQRNNITVSNWIHDMKSIEHALYQHISCNNFKNIGQVRFSCHDILAYYKDYFSTSFMIEFMEKKYIYRKLDFLLQINLSCNYV